MGSPPWELTIAGLTMQPNLRIDAPHFSGDHAVCRMARWFRARHDAEAELASRLDNGWIGALHDCVGIWRVDVVRRLGTAD